MAPARPTRSERPQASPAPALSRRARRLSATSPEPEPRLRRTSAQMGTLYDATWGRAFAAIYDRGLKAVEQGGLREMRQEVLFQAKGRTVDLGAGTGVNFDLFPEAVSELVMVEPGPHMI